MTAELIVRRSPLPNLGTLCVCFIPSGPRPGPYPAFYCFDQRDADAFMALGKEKIKSDLLDVTYLELLDRFWQSRQIDKVDNLLQEMENETLKKQQLDLSAPEFQPRQQS